MTDIFPRNTLVKIVADDYCIVKEQLHKYESS